MADSRTLDGFARKLGNVAKDLEPAKVQKDLAAAGTVLAREVDRAVRADFGDQSLSGWRRKRPIPVVGYSEAAKSVPSGVFIAPGTTGSNWRNGLGPMRVMDSGRQSYAAGDYRQSGTRTRKKDGMVVAKRRKVKRTVGATTGRGTWGDAQRAIDAKAAKAMNEGVVRRVLYRYF